MQSTWNAILHRLNAQWTVIDNAFSDRQIELDKAIRLRNEIDEKRSNYNIDWRQAYCRIREEEMSYSENDKLSMVKFAQSLNVKDSENLIPHQLTNKDMIELKKECDKQCGMVPWTPREEKKDVDDV